MRLPYVLICILSSNVVAECQFGNNFTRDYFCDLDCEDDEHPLCKFIMKNLELYCASVYGSMKPSLRTRILDLHNDVRKAAALGGLTGRDSVPLPYAQDMEAMSWDSTLEIMAQTWADQCVAIYDGCRRITDTLVAGQNIGERDFAGTVPSLAEDVIDDWIEERRKFVFADVYLPYSKTQRFTQMIWASTCKVGCGYSVYKEHNSKSKKFLLVCYYFPSGNVENGTIYSKTTQEEDVCKSCPNKKCLPSLEGLCGDEDPKVPDHVRMLYEEEEEEEEDDDNLEAAYTECFKYQEKPTDGGSASSLQATPLYGICFIYFGVH